jgi:RHS repeat-associated protein
VKIVSMRAVAMFSASLLVALLIVPVSFAVGPAPAARATPPTPSLLPSSVALSASTLNFQAGQSVTLVATTDVDVAPSASILRITDTTTGTRVASCATGTTCTTSVVFYTGAPHTYRATVNSLTSSPVTLTRAAWTVSLASDQPSFVAGGTTTFTATTNQSVSATNGNYRIGIYDVTADSLIGSCLAGAACSVAVPSPTSQGAAHSYIAAVSSASGSTAYSSITDSQAVSNQVSPVQSTWAVTLVTDSTQFAVGQSVTLTATTNQNVGGTGGLYEIDIYDKTTNARIASCATGTVCAFTSTALFVSGAPHTYVAAVAAVGNDANFSTAGGVQATSNDVVVDTAAWSVTLTSDVSTFAMNQDVTFTATANQALVQYGPYEMVLFDQTTGAFAGGCTVAATSCTFHPVLFAAGGPHRFVAQIGNVYNGNPTFGQLTNVQATSNTVDLTRQSWTLSLTISQPTFANGDWGTVVTATANQALGAPYQYLIYIYDVTTGQLVGYCPNNYSNQCSGGVGFQTGGPHTFRAEVSDRNNTTSSLGTSTNVQAVSNEVTLTRLPWTLSLTESAQIDPYYHLLQTTFTATANQPVNNAPYQAVIYDFTLGQAVGYCSWTAATCSFTTYLDPLAPPHSYIGYVAVISHQTYEVSDIQAMSNGVSPDMGVISAAEMAGGSNGAEKGCQCSHADPVNSATGEFYLNSTDIGLPGVGPAVSVGRSYSSSNAGVAGVFGYGTSANFDSRLLVTTPGDSVDPLPRAVQIIQENGASVKFLEGADHTYFAPPRTLASLRWDSASHTWVFVRHSRETLTFNAGGLLASLADLDGNTISLTRNGSNQVTAITGSGARTITLTWSAGHITVAADSAGRTVKYGYDANSNLTSVTGVDGKITRLGYDSAHYVTSVTKPGGGVTTNTYDSANRVTSQQDPIGRITTFSYGATATTTIAPDGSQSVETYSGGRLASQTRASGTSVAETTTFVYDAANNVASVTDPTGAVTSSTYDAAGNELTRTDPLGHVTTWTYDSHGDVTSITDPLGNQSTATYSPTGDALTSTSPGNHTQTWTHNTNGTVATSVDARGKSTSHSYDSAGRPAGRTDPDGRTQSIAYNAAGIVTTQTDSAGKVITLTSDAAGRVLTVKDPNLHTTKYTYDADGNVLTTVDAGAHLSSQAYNLAGERTSSTDANAKVTTYTYTAAGLPATVTDPNGNTTTMAYNAAHRLVSTTDPDGRVTTYTNDLDGRRLTTTRPSGAVTTTAYNAAGEPTTLTDANGQVTAVVYDADGRKTKVTDPLNRSASFTYTPDSQVAAVTFPGTQTETYSYDAAGNLTQFTNADGKAATYIYDPAGLVSSKTEPGGLTTSYTYDTAGRVSVTTSPDLTTATNTYDSAGQLTTVHYSTTGSTDIKFTYTTTGQRATMVDATGTSSYSYDPVGRLLSEKNGAATAIGYSYDPAGRLTSIAYPGTHTVSYGYDKSGDVTGVGDWAAHSTTFTWTADRQLATQVDPNGLTQTDTYDPAGQITAMSTTLAATVKAKFSYGYDTAGQMTSDTTIDPTTTGSGVARVFGYDTNSQIAAVTTGGVTGTYSATAAGVLTATPTAALTTNSAQQLTASTPATGPATSFTYSANGSRTSSTLAAAGTTPAATTTYTYSATGALASVVLPGTGGTISYKTNGDGVRQSRTQGTTTTKLLWSNNASTPRLLDDGTYSYIYGPTGNPIERVNDSTQAIQYLLGDNIGSVRLITDPTGAILSTNRYDAYGNRTTHTGTVDSTIGFAGTWTDLTTGLVYLQARDYDPKTAQFTSYDPAVERTHQPYAYVANSPLLRTDPTGLWFNFGSNPMGPAQGGLLLGELGNILVGLGDGGTLGATQWARDAFLPGTTCLIAKDGFYYGGVVAGLAIITFLTSGGAELAAGGVEVEAIAANTAAKLPEGYSSFSAAKRAMGSPGDGNVFDHVVEQSQIGRSEFTAEEIHNPFNMNPVSARTNQLKANYYSSKQPFTDGGTVRDWLTGQSFQEQYEFGMDILVKIASGLLR